MGSLAPPSASSPASLLLSSSSLAMDTWFFNSPADQLLTQALSASASSSSSSGASMDVSPPFAHSNFKYSDGALHVQTQSKLSQVGSPLSSSSICKDGQPESPAFNQPNCSKVSEMSSKATEKRNPIAESGGGGTAHHHQAPQRGSYNKAATPAHAQFGTLSPQAAAGVGVSKVNKRRARVNKKVPITVLSADASNFRAMVQQLTGIPAPQSLTRWWGTSDVPLLKPQPTRLGPLDHLPTLDTSTSCLAPRMNPFMRSLSPLQGRGNLSFNGNYHPSMINYDAPLSSASMATDSFGLHGNAKLDGYGANGEFKHLPASNEGQHYAVAAPPSTSMESFLIDDDDHNLKVSYNTIDSWLAFDGGVIANHSPKVVKFTKIAS